MLLFSELMFFVIIIKVDLDYLSVLPSFCLECIPVTTVWGNGGGGVHISANKWNNKI